MRLSGWYFQAAWHCDGQNEHKESWKVSAIWRVVPILMEWIFPQFFWGILKSHYCLLSSAIFLDNPTLFRCLYPSEVFSMFLFSL